MSAQKSGLHPRNRHQHRYDLAALCQTTPELTSFLIRTPAGEQSVDFANPQAVKALNKALLAHFYAVTHWDIPPGFLCPPVPGRADYIHHLADLLGETTGSIPAQATILTWAWAPIVFIRLSASMNMAGDLPVVKSATQRCPARRLSFRLIRG